MINERIRVIRKAKKMTQEEFGRTIGASRDSVATYENGRVTPPEPVIKLICTEFGVDYDWLKHGEGEMYANEEAEILAALGDLISGEKHKTTKALIKGLVKLNDDQLNAIDAYVDILLKELGE